MALTREQLEALRQFNTPTVSNAIETFGLRPKTAGFLRPEIGCMFPDMGVMVGYAATAVICASRVPSEAQKALKYAWWEEIRRVPSPRVAVLQDLDYPNPVGSFWGEVNGSIHQALGCVGTVTDGGVRDLDEVEATGFQYFASCVLVSHAYVHLERVGGPVTVGGVEVNPGDLIHADKHGVLVLPAEVADRVAEACRKVDAAERPVIEYCRTTGEVDLKILRELSEAMAKARG